MEKKFSPSLQLSATNKSFNSYLTEFRLDSEARKLELVIAVRFIWYCDNVRAFLHGIFHVEQTRIYLCKQWNIWTSNAINVGNEIKHMRIQKSRSTMGGFQQRYLTQYDNMIIIGVDLFFYTISLHQCEAIRFNIVPFVHASNVLAFFHQINLSNSS